MDNNNVPKGYFTEKTMLRLIINNVIGSNRLILRSVEAMLACKLTLTYGIYHQMMDWRILAMSEETMSYKQAENMADFINQLVPKHYTAPTELMPTQEESENETIKKYEEYKNYLDLFEGMAFVPRVVDKFCETVYNADDIIHLRHSAISIIPYMPKSCYYIKCKELIIIHLQNNFKN